MTKLYATARDHRTGKPDQFDTIAGAGRTKFQMRHIDEVSNRNGFEHFCGNPGCDVYYRGPFALSWYEKGEMKAQWVGQKKVLRELL